MQQFEYRQLSTADEVEQLVAFHNANSKRVAFDTETTGLDPFKDTLTALILQGYHEYQSCQFAPEHLPIVGKLRGKTLVLQNFKFDYRMCHRAGVDLRACGDVLDAMLLSHLVDENRVSHGLEALVTMYFNGAYKDAFWAKYKSFTDAPVAEQLEYAGKDVIYTGMLATTMLAELASEDISPAFIKHVHDLALALYDTELQGLCVDVPHLVELGTTLKPLILAARDKMNDSAPAAIEAVRLEQYAKQVAKAWKPRGQIWKYIETPEFNWNSHGQVGNLLYDKLCLPEQKVKDKKTKAWRRTVDDDALSKIEAFHPVVGLLREHSTYQKVYTAFIEGTLERLHEGRIYPGFNINGTVTGRISSADPNMQQLPSKGEWARVRGIYIPDPGHILFSCDYAQLEVVIAAHFSQDANLLKIIHEGASKHDITADSLGIPRSTAKTLNFAAQYQCTSRKFEEIMGCSPADATYAWNKYWETYAGEKKVIDECKSMVDAGKPIRNPFGRLRRFPTSFEKPWHRESAYRQAYASLIQGTGADSCHRAFSRTSQAYASRSLGRALFEVHDEIAVSAVKERADEAKAILTENMVEAGRYANLTLPLTVVCSEALERWTK